MRGRCPALAALRLSSGVRWLHALRVTMYSTCLFCRHSLGRNEDLETFPVGRRLAFDQHAGRLWVICGVCARWNLTPLEERWEAVEQCERIVRSLRPIAATDRIALYRIPSGVRLVRVGTARWREVAAWRYGRRLWWRHARARAAQTASWLLPYAVGPPVMPGLSGVLVGSALVGAAQRWYLRRKGEQPAIYVAAERGRATVRVRHLNSAVLLPASTSDAELRMRVRSDDGSIEVTGPDALRLASRALVRVNGDGGEQTDIDIAIRFVADAGSGEAYIADMARRVAARRARGDPPLRGTILAPENDFAGPVARFPSLTRLALEIAAHETAEAWALEGELAALVDAWREAEEIATIADNLLLPQAVVERLRDLRNMFGPSGAAT